MQELNQDYLSKQQEAERQLSEAQDEAQKILSKANKDAQETRIKILREAEDSKEKMLKEVYQKTEQMVQQAERTCELMKRDIEDKIEKRALEKTIDLIPAIMPAAFIKDSHTALMKELQNSEFQLGHLSIPKGVHEVQVVAALPLTEAQKKDLHAKVKEKVGQKVSVKEKVDADIIAGAVITIGSVVIDASLRYKIQKQIHKGKE